MTEEMEGPVPDVGPEFDATWLNDRSDYQQNFVHGLRNPIGLKIQYRLEGQRVVASWTADHRHVGFPGIVHGGLVTAVLDDAIARIPLMLHRWVVTAKLETHFRAAAPVGEPLHIEAWRERQNRRVIVASSRITRLDGELVAEATGTSMVIPDTLRRQMVAAWPSFAAYFEAESG